MKIYEIEKELLKLESERSDMSLDITKILINNAKELYIILEENELISDLIEKYTELNTKNYELLNKYEELKRELVNIINEV